MTARGQRSGAAAACTVCGYRLLSVARGHSSTGGGNTNCWRRLGAAAGKGTRPNFQEGQYAQKEQQGIADTGCPGGLRSELKRAAGKLVKGWFQATEIDSTELVKQKV